MILPPAEFALNEQLIQAFSEAHALMPRRPFVNLTNDSMYTLYFPDRHNFHPMYMDWQDFVYDDYPEKLAAFIRRERPFLLYPAKRTLPDKTFVAHFPDRNLYLLKPPDAE